MQPRVAELEQQISALPAGSITKKTVNGKEYDKNYITFPTIMEGAVIDFDMTDKPNLTRGTSDQSLPYSFSNELKAKDSKKGKKN